LLTFVQAVHFLSVLAGSSLVVDVVVVVVLSTIVSEVASDAGVALVAVGLGDGLLAACFLLLDLGSKGRSEKKEVVEGLLGLGCFFLRGRATMVFSMYSLLPSSASSPPLLVLLLFVVAAGPVVVAALLFESSPSRSNAARARRIRPGAGYSSGGGR
jgi:hypothetical protein